MRGSRPRPKPSQVGDNLWAVIEPLLPKVSRLKPAISPAAQPTPARPSAAAREVLTPAACNAIYR